MTVTQDRMALRKVSKAEADQVSGRKVKRGRRNQSRERQQQEGETLQAGKGRRKAERVLDQKPVSFLSFPSISLARRFIC